MTKQMYIFGNNKGGTGKTESALSLITALNDLGVDFDYGEIDEVRKLSIILGDRKAPLVSLKTNPGELSGFQAEELQKFLNPVVQLVEKDVSILDMGANVPQRFFEWAESSMLKELVETTDTRLTFIGVTTPEGLSLAPAVSFLKRAYHSFKGDADYVLVNNNISGSAEVNLRENKSTASIMEDLEKSIAGLEVINIPNCPPTKSLTFARGVSISIYQLMELVEETRDMVIKGEDISSSSAHASYADAVDLEGITTKAEKQLYLMQQLLHLKKWVRASHDLMTDKLDLKKLASEKEEAA